MSCLIVAITDMAKTHYPVIGAIKDLAIPHWSLPLR